MEVSVNLYTLATWTLCAVGSCLIGLDQADVTPGSIGVVLGFALLFWSGILFINARLERFASRAFRHGMEVARLPERHQR